MRLFEERRHDAGLCIQCVEPKRRPLPALPGLPGAGEPQLRPLFQGSHPTHGTRCQPPFAATNEFQPRLSYC